MRKRISLEEQSASGGGGGEVIAQLREEIASVERKRVQETTALKARLDEVEKGREEEVNSLKKRVAELEARNRELSERPVSAAAAAPLTTEEKLRRAVVAEMIKTEKDYVDDLIVSCKLSLCVTLDF